MVFTRRQFVQVAGSAAGVVGLTAPAIVSAATRIGTRRTTATERARPIELQRNGTFDGIMDMYVGNKKEVDLAQAKRLGVQAVIYRTSLGLYDRPLERQAYLAAKARARELNLLWGAFHVPSHEEVDRQMSNFLRIEDGTDQKTLMVLDWESTSKGTATLAQMRDFVGKFRKSRGYYPMIYGGDILLEQCGGHLDDVLAKCPLWYIYILSRKQPVLRLPKATWSDYTLWQYSTQYRSGNDPYPADVLPGADWSRFKGTATDLRRAWPFRIS